MKRTPNLTSKMLDESFNTLTAMKDNIIDVPRFDLKERPISVDKAIKNRLNSVLELISELAELIESPLPKTETYFKRVKGKTAPAYPLIISKKVAKALKKKPKKNKK